MPLYDKENYKAPYDYLISKDIVEYDIEKANISILYTMGKISKSKYESLKSMDNYKRKVSVGYILRDNPRLNDTLKEGLYRCREWLFHNNNIEDTHVLYINRDAVSTIDTPLTNLSINDIIHFRRKDVYTSFYRLIDGIDMLYYNDNDKEYIRFKYINDDSIKHYHGEYLVDFLLSLAYTAQNGDIIDCVDMVKNFFIEYRDKKLPLGYYREFNHTNRYKIGFSRVYSYYVDKLDSSTSIYSIDIGYNSLLLRKLYKIFTNIYFMTR